MEEVPAVAGHFLVLQSMSKVPPQLQAAGSTLMTGGGLSEVGAITTDVVGAGVYRGVGKLSLWSSSCSHTFVVYRGNFVELLVWLKHNVQVPPD
jgi:hypothetical protein